MTNVEPNLDDRFNLEITESYSLYKKNGARSSSKLEPIHGFIHNELEKTLIIKFPELHIKVKSAFKGKEEVVNGMFYPKRVDISISVDKTVIYVISIKSIQSNYKQNANNYFENMIGECLNITLSGISFAHILVLPIAPDYLQKNGDIKKTENIQYDDISKYMNLFTNSKNEKLLPSSLCVYLIKNENKIITKVNPLSLANENDKQKSVIQSNMNLFSLKEFLNKIIDEITFLVS